MFDLVQINCEQMQNVENEGKEDVFVLGKKTDLSQQGQRIVGREDCVCNDLSTTLLVFR